MWGLAEIKKMNEDPAAFFEAKIAANTSPGCGQGGLYVFDGFQPPTCHIKPCPWAEQMIGGGPQQ
ncbi:MAG: hypothetical protein WCW26_02640 [Candidatus Buchananbacteria bacterium]